MTIDEKMLFLKDKASKPPVPKGLLYLEQPMRLPVARSIVQSPRVGNYTPLIIPSSPEKTSEIKKPSEK
jgi:hypothetical protein